MVEEAHLHPSQSLGGANMWFRRSRVVRLALTVVVLAFQIPMTVAEIPRLGLSRYSREVGAGILNAVRGAVR